MGTDFDPGTDFSRYKTFDFREGSKPRDPVARRSVEYAIQTALEGRGLRNVDGGGDLDIFIHFVLSSEMRFETYGYGTAGWSGWGWAGGTVTTAGLVVVVVGLVGVVVASVVACALVGAATPGAAPCCPSGVVEAWIAFISVSSNLMPGSLKMRSMSSLLFMDCFSLMACP
jgi:hypothetical protein